MPSHQEIANLIWQIADLLRGPYRPPQYERVMLPMTVLRRFDCVLTPTKDKVLAAYKKNQAKPKPLTGEALDKVLSTAAGQRFHNHSPLDFANLNVSLDHRLGFGEQRDGDWVLRPRHTDVVEGSGLSHNVEGA